MKPDRLFYTSAATLFLVLTAVGFKHYIFEGKHANGSSIDPLMLATVMAHGSSILAWYVLFFVQSLLISMRNRRLHMTLGWSVLVIAPILAVTAALVAARSMRVDPRGVVFDWPARPFLLILYSEIALFAAFVTIGVLYRKRPRVHRPMMLLASLAILTGATGRIALIHSIFGLHGWVALFGPVVALGAILLLVRLATTRSIDREFVAGYAAYVLVTLVAARLAATDVWSSWAGTILNR